MISQLDHPNLVKLLGFSVNPYSIIMELVPKGTLYDLVNNQEFKMDWNLRLKIALDIAQGMAYMHSKNPPYFHRDLKTPNILVCSRDSFSRDMVAGFIRP